MVHLNGVAAPRTSTAQMSHHAMGTVMAHKVFGQYAEDSLTAVCDEVERIERLLSRFHPDSEISRINNSAGIRSERVSPDTFVVLSKAVEFWRFCPSCLDVTIGPLIALWSTARQTGLPPDAESIRHVLPLVNCKDVLLDPWEMTAGLSCAGQSIDLGGIGKGYTGDRIVEVFKQFGITSAYSNLGGNVVTLGAKPDGSPWRIGIQHPRQEAQLIASVAVAGETVVTSGDYQRYFFDRQGQRRHHILNPSSGYPADAGLVSVSVVAENSMSADALSTILFIAGIEKGLEILNQYGDAEAVFIDDDLHVFVTQNLRSRFQAAAGLEVTFLDKKKGERT
jgi:FAD:protein FMN transferase